MDNALPFPRNLTNAMSEAVRDCSCPMGKNLLVQLRQARGRTSSSEYGRLDQERGFRGHQMLIWRISREVESVDLYHQEDRLWGERHLVWRNVIENINKPYNLE